MAHFAELDENNIVVRVIVGIDESVGDGEVIYQQETGTVWKRTSYNTTGNEHRLGGIPFRGNYAGVGYYYDAEKDVFIPPKPFPSWVLNETIFGWQPPIEKPNDGKMYTWDENTVSWIER